MRGLEEIYLKGFSLDKYFGIASADELEKLEELYKNIVIQTFYPHFIFISYTFIILDF